MNRGSIVRVPGRDSIIFISERAIRSQFPRRDRIRIPRDVISLQVSRERSTPFIGGRKVAKR